MLSILTDYNFLKNQKIDDYKQNLLYSAYEMYCNNQIWFRNVQKWTMTRTNDQNKIFIVSIDNEIIEICSYYDIIVEYTKDNDLCIFKPKLLSIRDFITIISDYIEIVSDAI